MIKIMTSTTWELHKADLAQAIRERDAAKEELRAFTLLKKHMHRKGITLRDVEENKAHVSWNPKHAPKLSLSDIKGAMSARE